METIFDIVAARLGSPAAITLANCLKRHYQLWKFQRWSDEATLSVARHILCDAKFAKLCRAPGWIINRREADYMAILGPELASKLGRPQRLDQLRAIRLSGIENPFEGLSNWDSGPGNGTALYEGAIPGWIGSGHGNELLYSIEGTLQNCLIAEIQGDTQGHTPSYASKLFYQAAKALEVLSVAEFISMRESTRECDEAFSEWSAMGEVATTTSLLRIVKKARGHAEMRKSDPNRVAKGIVLGFLLDELEGRLQYPNGMNFAANIMGHFLVRAPEALTGAKGIVAANGFDPKKLAISVDRLRHSAMERFALDVSSRPRLSNHEIADVERAADSFREIAFLALHKMDEELRQVLFSIANELWRWAFFERDAVRWAPTGEDANGADILLRWLERPWGILRADEMDELCRDLFEHDDPNGQPKAMLLLLDFFRYGVDRALDGIFGSSFDGVTGRKVLRTFAQRRISLAEKRRAVTTVNVDDIKARQELAAAQTVIQAFGIWVQANGLLMDQIEARPETLAAIFGNGSWSRSSSTELPSLSRTQLLDLGRFSTDPAAFVARYFDFATLEANPYSVLDCYPPENFVVLTT